MNNKSTSYLLNTSESLEKEKVRLVKQAQVLFNLESPIIARHLSKVTSPLRALDIGCGNTAYLGMAKQQFEFEWCVGIERNKNLIEQAKTINPDIDVKCGDILNDAQLASILTKEHPNFINLRFVLQHLTRSERLQLMTNIKKHLPSGSLIIVTEPNDLAVTMTQESQNLRNLIHRTIEIQESRGGTRTLPITLSAELKEVGLSILANDIFHLNIRNCGLDSLKEVILPIWRSQRPGDNNAENNRNVDRASEWLSEMSRDGAFEISFPIHIFAIMTT